MKPSLPRVGVLTVALLTLNVAIALALINRLAAGNHAEQLLATPATEAVTAANRTTPLRPTEDLSAIRDRALFHASRRYYVAAPPASSPTTRPDYRLVGTLVIPSKPTLAVLLHTTTQQRRKVKPGDELDGWLVRAVENRRVVISSGAEELEIVSDAPTASEGLSVVSLVRAPTAESGNTRVLGATGRTAIAAAPEPAKHAPRLYKPPPQ